MLVVVGLIGLIGQRIAGTNAANAFFYPGTIGVLALLFAYLMTNIGAISHLFVRARRRPLWQLAIPLLAIAFIVFTIYKNVHGALAPYSHFPWFVLAWLAVGGLVVALAPGVAKRIGTALTSELGRGSP